MLRVLFAVILLLPLPLYANETTTTTTTTIPEGEVEEVETFDGTKQLHLVPEVQQPLHLVLLQQLFLNGNNLQIWLYLKMN